MVANGYIMACSPKRGRYEVLEDADMDQVFVPWPGQGPTSEATSDQPLSGRV